MASMIYGVSRNGKRGIVYDPYDDQESPKNNQHFSPFSYLYPEAQTQNIIDTQEPNVFRKSGKINLKGPKRFWVPRDKIIYVADILFRRVNTPIMVPGPWMLV